MADPSDSDFTRYERDGRGSQSLAIVRPGDFRRPLPGQYYDEEIGLHENWHRTYDPGTGRYLQPDPHRSRWTDTAGQRKNRPKAV